MLFMTLLARSWRSVGNQFTAYINCKPGGRSVHPNGGMMHATSLKFHGGEKIAPENFSWNRNVCIICGTFWPRSIVKPRKDIILYSELWTISFKSGLRTIQFDLLEGRFGTPSTFTRPICLLNQKIQLWAIWRNSRPNFHAVVSSVNVSLNDSLQYCRHLNVRWNGAANL